jgi:hypothetical protein
VVGFLTARLIAAAFASTVGALAVAIGAAGALAGMPAGRALRDHPVALLAAAVILAVAGAAFQYPRAWGRGAASSAAKRSGPGRDATGAPEPG